MNIFGKCDDTYIETPVAHTERICESHFRRKQYDVDAVREGAARSQWVLKTIPNAIGIQLSVDIGALFMGPESLRFGFDVHVDLDDSRYSGLYFFEGKGVMLAPSAALSLYVAYGKGDWASERAAPDPAEEILVPERSRRMRDVTEVNAGLPYTFLGGGVSKNDARTWTTYEFTVGPMVGVPPVSAAVMHTAYYPVFTPGRPAD